MFADQRGNLPIRNFLNLSPWWISHLLNSYPFEPVQNSMYNYHHYVSCISYGLTFFDVTGGAIGTTGLKSSSHLNFLTIDFVYILLNLTLSFRCQSKLIHLLRKIRIDYFNWLVTASMKYCHLDHDDIFLVGKK